MGKLIRKLGPRVKCDRGHCWILGIRENENSPLQMGCERLILGSSMWQMDQGAETKAAS